MKVRCGSNGREVLSFKCNDGGHSGCDWIVTGENEDLLIFQIEMHAQNNHNLAIDEGGKKRFELDHAGSA